MIISAIVAIARNFAIGHQNEIPWYLPADLKYFKKVTTGHHVIMGRKSFESIGRQPLPNRTNVVITRDPFFVATGCTVVHSLREALAFAIANGETEAFIIGGGEVYRQSWPLLDRIYLTEVSIEPEADVFFPKVNKEEWQEVSSEAHPADEKNEFSYVFRVLERV